MSTDRTEYFPVLITTCLQNDFISITDQMNPFLHIGKDESIKILGIDPTIGPMSQFMSWFRSLDQTSVSGIHITSSLSSDHVGIQQFGLHTIDGSDGAKMILNLEKGIGSNEEIVKASSINVFHGTNLEQSLLCIFKSQKKKLRIGIVGVWTEATIQFLCYELVTRFSHLIDRVCVCSSLTASRTRSQHFNALSQLQSVMGHLGVYVIDSIVDFQKSLLGGDHVSNQIFDDVSKLNVQYKCDNKLDGEHLKILAFLYKNSKDVKLVTLHGGFSGSKVFLITSKDIYGHEQAKTILKIGARRKVVQERVNFERVEDLLVNNAPKILGYIELENWAGIKFSFASMSGNPVTFKALYSKLEVTKIETILRSTFEEILSRLYYPSNRENTDLLAEYDFDGKGWAYFVGGCDTPSVVQGFIKKLLKLEDVSSERIRFPNGSEAKNVSIFLDKVIPLLKGSILARRGHNVSLVHGDLNGGNILLDDHQNIWIIDFEYSKITHSLKDITKLEHDILFEYTAFSNEYEMQEGYILVSYLTNIVDLGAELPQTLDGLTSHHIIKAYKIIRVMRKIISKMVGYFRHPLQLFVPLLRYSLFSIALETCSNNQKILCLAAACGYAEKIEHYLLHKNIQIYWLPHLDQGIIGQTILVGRTDWKRNLKSDIIDLKNEKVDRVICLLTTGELEKFTNSVDFHKQMNLNFNFTIHPLPHQKAPSLEEVHNILKHIYDSISRNERIVLMSIAGLGRPSVILACLLINRFKFSPQNAIKTLRDSRGPRAFESDSQVSFVENFK